LAFGVLASLTRLRRRVLVAGRCRLRWPRLRDQLLRGTPPAAAIFTSGDKITNMARLVGYGTFLVEHLIFGPYPGLALVKGVKRALTTHPLPHRGQK
jgi:hypothetical protein